MTVQELMEILENCDPDTEVRIAQQPRWPFEYSICDAVEIEEPEGIIRDDESKTESPTIVYLVEGRQLGYLPIHVGVEIGWADADDLDDALDR